MQVVGEDAVVQAWSVQKERCAWLLGAGASAASGVPTATQIRDDLLLRIYAQRHQLVRENLSLQDPNVVAQLDLYFNDRNGMVAFGADDDYSRAFELALHDEAARKHYLQQKIQGRQPSYGQRVLGAFLSGGQADIVVTTNFDELIEGAAADAYSTMLPSGSRRLLNIAGLDSRDRGRAVLEPTSLPMLLKLHGDFRETSLKNLEHELAHQDAVLRQSVHDLSRRYGLIVVGYSGRDRSVMDMLQSATATSGAWPAGLWWCTRDPDSINGRVGELLAQAEKSNVPTYLVSVGSFDELMGELANQVELSTEARRFISSLRTQERAAGAAPPPNADPTGAIIRYNALPIVGAPRTALRAKFDIIPRPEFRSRARETEFRGAASMGGGALWGWAEEKSFSKLAGATVETHEVDLTTGPLEPVLHSLMLEGLTKALCSKVPARPKISRRDYALVLHEWPDSSDEHLGILATMRDAYQDDISGRLPTAKYGVNRDGSPRQYAEAIRLHLEHRWGLTWMIFSPFTWIEPRALSTDRLPTIDAVGEWIRERWVTRKQNQTWANLIDVWAAAIAPRREETVVPMTRALGGETFDSFRIGPTTAYSRESR